MLVYQRVIRIIVFDPPFLGTNKAGHRISGCSVAGDSHGILEISWLKALKTKWVLGYSSLSHRLILRDQQHFYNQNLAAKEQF